MSNVIAFLESLGGNAAAHRAATLDPTGAIAALGLDEPAARALATGDTAALARLLGGRTAMTCLLMPADGEEPAEEPKRDDDEVRQAAGTAH